MSAVEFELPINMALLSNPLNWLIIVMILILVSYSIFVIYQNSATLLPVL